MEVIEINNFFKALIRYKKGVLNFPEEEFSHMDSSYIILEFSGEPEKIHQESSQAIKKGLNINGDALYFILFVNDKDSIDKVMAALPFDEIRDLALIEKYGIYTLPQSEGKSPQKLILIFQ